jgi:3D (Asp-Asp-Asp) domain-containing protein
MIFILGGVLLASIGIGVTGWFVVKPTIEQELQSKIKAYGFLSNYVCWEDSFRVTLYTTDPTECSKTKNHPFFGITYSGVRAVPYRTVAVDPTVVPLGSILIDAETGYTFIAEDTGNAVKGRHVDLFIGQSTVKNNALMSKWNSRPRQFFVIETRKKDLHNFPFKV